MLSEILASVQRFERRHGVAPNIVYLNAGHWWALMCELPGLRWRAGGAFVVPLGFHILILPREALAHPRAARVDRRHGPAAVGCSAGTRPAVRERLLDDEEQQQPAADGAVRNLLSRQLGQRADASAGQRAETGDAEAAHQPASKALLGHLRLRDVLVR